MVDLKPMDFVPVNKHCFYNALYHGFRASKSFSKNTASSAISVTIQIVLQVKLVWFPNKPTRAAITGYNIMQSIRLPVA